MINLRIFTRITMYCSKMIYNNKKLWNVLTFAAAALKLPQRGSTGLLLRRRRTQWFRRRHELIFWWPHQEGGGRPARSTLAIGWTAACTDYRLVAAAVRSHNNDNNNCCYNDDLRRSPVIVQNSMASYFFDARKAHNSRRKSVKYCRKCPGVYANTAVVYGAIKLA